MKGFKQIGNSSKQLLVTSYNITGWDLMLWAKIITFAASKMIVICCWLFVVGYLLPATDSKN